MRIAAASFLVVSVAALGLVASLGADETPVAKLEKHPLADAKAGEWRRSKRTVREETRYYVERVLAVKPAEGHVFFDVLEITEDGKQRRGVEQPGRWFSVPKFQAMPGQQYRADEMVMVDVGGKRVAARHLTIVEPAQPAAPGRTRTREVWYSNDVLGNGKVKEQVDDPPTTLTTLDWGTMTPEELTRARAEYRLDQPTQPQQPGTPASPAPAPSPPSSGGAGACGAACGGK
jgi:hypothetical protein